jgi:hypothetical protein
VDYTDPSTIGGILGVVLANALIALIGIRKALNSVAIDTAHVSAEVNLLAVLQEQAAVATGRAEKAEKERNDALVEVGKLQGQIAALTIKVGFVCEELEKARAEIHGLRNELSGFNRGPYIQDEVRVVGNDTPDEGTART